MTGTYHLSYDEQRAAKARLLANARLQRLLQVRAQDKQLAKARSRNFKQLCVDSAQQLKDELVLLISQQRELELAHLREQYQAALDGLASGQRNAAISAQQLAIERQQKHELFLQREKEAQQRFSAALSRVQAARQAELQVVLDKMQRRQEIMHQQRELAKTFAEQQRQQAAQDAQRQAELDLLEEQRRRQNQVSRIDFRYSRLHELGVPQLVVNHKELPADGTPDAASQAQQEAVRTMEDQLLLQQQQQQNAKKAVERGVNAQMLLQAERNRQRMEQALRELESNEIEQRKQDLTTGNLSAAPLLRKWQQQKRKAQAKRAFEQDFLPGPARAQHGLPSFLAYGTEASAAVAAGGAVPRGAAAAEEAEDLTTPEGQAAAAARALRLVTELEQQRQAEAAAAQLERQRRQQQPAAAARPSSSAASSEVDIPVAVEDLMDFIPAASTQTAPSTPGPVSETAECADVSSVATAEMAASAAAAKPVEVVTKPAAAAGASQPEGTPESAKEQQTSDSAAAAAAGRSPVDSSQDSIAAIMQAADEVLRQLPAEMQAAAARRAAAAAGRTLPRPSALETSSLAPTAQRDSAIDEANASLPLAAGSVDSTPSAAPVGGSQGLSSSSSNSSDRRSSRATDSSADAAAILQELKALQQQLGAELLGSSTAGSDLEQLAAFDDEVQHLVQQQLKQPAAAALRRSQAAAAAAAPPPPPPAVAQATVSAPVPASAAGAPSGSQQQQPGRYAAPAAAAADVGAQAPLMPEHTSQTDGAVNRKTELENLIDQILAPDYPTNLFGPLAGPQPSVDSPTRPAGRAGRRAAAESAAAAAPRQQQLDQSYDLAAGVREVQQELKALGLPSVSLSSLSSSTSGDNDALLQSILQNPLSSSSSDVTLPTTVLGAMGPAALTSAAAAAAAGRVQPLAAGRAGSDDLSRGLPSSSSGAAAAASPQQHANLQQQQQQQQRKLQPELKASTSAPSLSVSMSTAAAAGERPQAPGDIHAQGQQSSAAAAAMAAARQAIMDLSSSLDSLSTSTTGTSDIDKLLQNMQQQKSTTAVRVPAEAMDVRGSVLSSSAVSLPSTLMRRPAATAPPVAAAAAETRTSVPVTTAGPTESTPLDLDASTVISLPATLQLQRQPAAAADEDPLATLRELLSLRDSDSSLGSPATAEGRTAGAAAGPPSISSSSISSMLDDELDQLLQKAMAGIGSSRPQQQQQGSIERALEAMVGGEGSAAAAAGSGGVRASMASFSTTIPSTVRAQLPPSTAAAAAAGDIARGAVGGARARSPAAAAAAGHAASPTTSGSSGSSSGSSGSGSMSSSSRSEAALRMAKQSARKRAAAAAAAAAASAVGSSSGMTSLPSTIERHLYAVAADTGRLINRLSTEGSEITLPSTVAVTAAGGVKRTGEVAVSPSLPSTVERVVKQQQQQSGAPWDHGSSRSCSLSLPVSLQQQQQPWSAAGPGSIGASSSASLPSTIKRLAGSSGSSTVGTSSSISKGLPPRPPAPAASSSASAVAAAALQQQEQHIRQSSKPAAAAAAGGVLPALEPIEEETTASITLTSGSPDITVFTSHGSQAQHRPTLQQGLVPRPAAVDPAATPSSSSSSRSISQSSGSSAAGSSSSSSGDDAVSSDSFSGVVSELMQHIDSTLASLPGASSDSIADQSVAPAAAAAAGSSGLPMSRNGLAPPSAAAAVGTNLHRQSQLPQPRQQQQLLQAQFRNSRTTSSSSGSGSSAAAGSFGLPLSPFGSGSSSSGTDSSTERFIQQAMADINAELDSPEMSGSSAAAAAAAAAISSTGTSRMWQQQQLSATQVVSPPAAATPRAATQVAANASLQEDSSTERFIQDSVADISADLDSPETSDITAGAAADRTGSSRMQQQHHDHHHQQQQLSAIYAVPPPAAAAPGAATQLSAETSLQEDSSTERFLEDAMAGMDAEMLSPKSSVSFVSGAVSNSGSHRLPQQQVAQPTLTPAAVAAEPAVIAMWASLGESTRQFEQGLAPAVRPTASAAHADVAAAAAAAAGGDEDTGGSSPSPTSSTAGSGSTTRLWSASAPQPPAAPANSAGHSTPAPATATAAELPQLSRQETISSSGDTDQLLGSLGSMLAGSTPASSGRSGVSSSSSELSFRATARQQSASVAATAELLADSAGLSSSDGSRGMLASPESSSMSGGQLQRQQPRAESSGLSQLLADILSEDPELAAQLSSQSLG